MPQLPLSPTRFGVAAVVHCVWGVVNLGVERADTWVVCPVHDACSDAAAQAGEESIAKAVVEAENVLSAAREELSPAMVATEVLVDAEQAASSLAFMKQRIRVEIDTHRIVSIAVSHHAVEHALRLAC